jgi:hypothetical protein
MPKTPIEYSKCLIYKICCKDPTITDIYVGHTTDLRRRKNCHRTRCNNENDKKYNCNVYQFIRDHGNFDNWEIIVLEKYPCNNANEARLRERYWLETLQATLNIVIPSRTLQQWTDDNKNIINEKKRKYREKNKKKNEQIECECGSKYIKSSQARHLKTEKHLKYLKYLINQDIIRYKNL